MAADVIQTLMATQGGGEGKNVQSFSHFRISRPRLFKKLAGVHRARRSD